MKCLTQLYLNLSPLPQFIYLTVRCIPCNAQWKETQKRSLRCATYSSYLSKGYCEHEYFDGSNKLDISLS